LWFSGGLGSVRLTVGLNDLKGLFQLGFEDNYIYMKWNAINTQNNAFFFPCSISRNSFLFKILVVM